MARSILKLRRCESGYETLDGRYVIERQDDYTECEHPLCETLHRRFHNPGRGALHPIMTVQWHVWDNHQPHGGDYAGGGDGRGFETKLAAEQWLYGYLAKEERSDGKRDTFRPGPDLHYRKVAANTYEVSDADGPAAIVQRDPGATTWSGYKLDGVTRLSGPYPGSRATAAANAVRTVREGDDR